MCFSSKTVINLYKVFLIQCEIKTNKYVHQWLSQPEFYTLSLSFPIASLAFPAVSQTTPAPNKPPPPPPDGGTEGASKSEYPKDLGNGVEMINREDCPGGYCETFLVRPPPAGMGFPMGMGMGMGMGSMPCCPQLPPSPCGGQQQPSCQLGPPPMACNSPCPSAAFGMNNYRFMNAKRI